MPQKVQTSIELSYNLLNREEAKSLLRLYNLFPEDSDIPLECLVRYVVGLCLFEKVETVAEARDMVYSLNDQLKSRFLILHGDGEKVKLHDVVRDVCISIASKGREPYLVRNDAGLKEWPQEDTFRHCSAISLMFDQLDKFPIGLDCPNLKLLQVQCKGDPRDDPTNESCTRVDSIGFFEGMKELKVVDLRSMCLQLTRQPLKSLLNIRTLCLDFCRLDNNTSSMIGSLKSLRVLSFFKSYIEELPSEIGQLEHLQILDLRFAGRPGRISPNILSKLDKLEELYAGENDMNDSIAELNSMSYLNTLDICTSVTAVLKLKHFCFDNLRRFRITIGSPVSFNLLLFRLSEGYGLQNSLSLNDCDLGMLYDFGIKVLLKRSKHVSFLNLKGLGSNIFDALDVDDSVSWEKLCVWYCDELKYLICRDIPGETFAFGKLQMLWLENLPAMKGLFPESMVKCLVQLQQLILFRCKKVEYIVAKKGGEDEKDSETIVFPKLTYLLLQDLDMLRSFCSNSDILFPKQVFLPNLEILHLGRISVVHIVDYQMQGGSFHKPRGLDVSYCEKVFNVVAPGQQKLFPNLQQLHVNGCCELEAVFNFEGLTARRDHAEVTLGQLMLLELGDLPKLMHVWRMVPKNLQGFQNLTSIDISNCESLRYILSPTIAKLLGNLMLLQVHKCKMIEEIIDTEEDLLKIKILDEIVTTKEEEQMIGDTILFPQLKEISLANLENLNCFCSGNCEFQFPSLNKLVISGCPNMKTFSSGPLSTGKLGEGNISIGGQEFWMGDLNTTIQNASELYVFILFNFFLLFLTSP
ncbi:unnamed protein product [Ilex paraguariensis]|uniref:Uncharacterized protein n=1 Tax=Ilex paraguariensis TaxID=185542 RepID=A0ABC8T1X7_9AQUA